MDDTYCSLEGFRSIFQPEWHLDERIKPVVGGEGSFVPVAFVDRSFQVPLFSMQCWEHFRLSQAADEHVHAGKGVRVANRYRAQLSVVHAKT